jgi:hypothetical protein
VSGIEEARFRQPRNRAPSLVSGEDRISERGLVVTSP